jgi:prevent-host-death family protein
MSKNDACISPRDGASSNTEYGIKGGITFMSFVITEDIQSVTDLKRNTRKILDRARRTGRPIVLTVNGKADAVLLDARTFEKYMRASNLARLIKPAEEDIEAGRTRSMREFLREFKHDRKV